MHLLPNTIGLRYLRRHFPEFFRWGLMRLGMALPLILATSGRAALFDLDGDGASDVWQAYYKVPSLDPAEDSDGDGLTNGQEATAGTDPLDPASRFGIVDLVVGTSATGAPEAVVLFGGIPGKSYQLQGATELARPAWQDVGAPLQATQLGRLEMKVPLDPKGAMRFFRMLVFDQDGDQDGLNAFEEAIIGTSDGDRGAGPAAGAAWLKVNSPGADPTGPMNNLREVDVAWVRAPEPRGTDAFLVSVIGTGGWHQLTSWKVPASGIPAEISTTPGIDGHHPKIKKLEPDSVSPDTVKKFVTGRIRGNGDFWLSSRALSPIGAFIHYKSVGFGSNADVDVFDYDIAQRGVSSGGLVVAYEIVTPLLVKPQGSQIPALRVVTWRVDVITGSLIGLQDSGPLGVYDLPSNPDAARIGIAHIAGNQYSIAYTSEGGSLSHRAIWTGANGAVTEAGGGTLAYDIRGEDKSSRAQQANAIAGLTSSGYLTAIRGTNSEMTMAVWERREDTDSDLFEPYLVADNKLDLGPNANGVFLVSPVLTDTWAYHTGDGDHLGQALAVGDFDGDGYQDVAIGAPTRNTSSLNNSGAVYIIGGNSSGLNNEPYESIWTQDSTGIDGVVEVGDLFGYSLAAGDFDNDGIDDLAIGVPGEDVGNVSTAGSVNILYGTPFGLAATGNQLVTQTSLGHVPQAFDYFGWSVAAGDFNGDGRDDLAISAPNETISGVDDAGAVYVMWGANTGLSLSGSAFLHQNVTGTYDQAEEFDWFGRVLVAGDFNGDNRDDLAVGIPYEDIGNVSNAGAVQVFYGSATTPFGVDIFVSQAGFANGEDIVGAAEANDLFGASLAVGDFDDDGAADLAIGVPGEDIGNIADGGAVNVVYGSFLGLTWFDNVLIQQDEFDPIGGALPSTSEAGDDFGRALAVGDFNGDGIDDLIVGAPHEGISGGSTNAGAVFYIRGSAAGLTATGSKVLYQDSVASEGGTDYGMNGASESGDQFGAALAAGDFNSDGESDLVVGIPYQDRDDHNDCGAVQIIPGSQQFTLTLQSDEEWFARTIDVVRAKVTDLAWEEENGIGGGMLYRENEFTERRHVASVTKTMTLLLAVEAIEAGKASLTDMVPVSDLAGGTGGSKLATYNAGGTEIKDGNGDEIPFIQPGDTMPLRLLLAGMMNESCNRSSVAIGQHIANKVKGNPDEFINMMNARAAQLDLDDSVFGHPAGGWVTPVQDMITLQREGVKHPLFVMFGGAATEIYGTAPPNNVLCGKDSKGNDKCNGPFAKFTTIGAYPGRTAWKGGNGGLWWSNGEATNVPARPNVAWCSASAVGVVDRLDRSIAIAVQQTGDRTEDCQRLFDYGFRKVFTPDLRGAVEFPKPGGVVGPEGPVRVRNFAIDRIDSNSAVTAIIDDNENLQLNIWALDFASRAITPGGSANKTFALIGGATFDPPALVDLASIPTPQAIRDFFGANLNGDHLDLSIWRVGAEP